MDVSNNHLVADIESVPQEDRSKYTKIPPSLFAAAERELGGKASVYVNTQRRTELTAWASKKLQKRRAQSKVAKESRKRNRV